MERLARLEVERPVLHLQPHVVAECAFERHEFIVRLAHAVGGDFVRIDECAPHHDPAVRPQGVGEQVGAVGMGPVVILRPRLPLRVRLHDESAEVRHDPVDLVHLAPPPRTHRGVERVGRGEPAQLDRRAEARREIHAEPVRPEHSGEGCHLGEKVGREHAGVGIHIREHRAVDPERRVGAGVVAIARVDRIGQVHPIPQ